MTQIIQGKSYGILTVFRDQEKFQVRGYITEAKMEVNRNNKLSKYFHYEFKLFKFNNILSTLQTRSLMRSRWKLCEILNLNQTSLEL